MGPRIWQAGLIFSKPASLFFFFSTIFAWARTGGEFSINQDVP